MGREIKAVIYCEQGISLPSTRAVCCCYFFCCYQSWREITECRYYVSVKVCSNRMSRTGIYSLDLAAFFTIRGKVGYISSFFFSGGGREELCKGSYVSWGSENLTSLKYRSFIVNYKPITLTRLETVVLTWYCRRAWCTMFCFSRILNAPFALCREIPADLIWYNCNLKGML